MIIQRTPKSPNGNWQEAFQKSDAYRIYQSLGWAANYQTTDKESYDANIKECEGKVVEIMAQSTEDQIEEAREALIKEFPKDKNLLKAFNFFNKQAAKQKKVMAAGKEDDSEAKEDWTGRLKALDDYKKAQERGLDVSSYSPKTKDEYDECLKKLKEQLNDGASPSTPSSEKTGEAPTVSSETTDHLTDTKGGKASITVDELTTSPEDDTLDHSWIDETRQHIQESASATGSIYQEEDPDNHDKTSLSFKLTKGEHVSEAVYTAKDRVQVSKDSQFEMYQAIVHDAIEKDLDITIGEKLDPTQQLMLYAAVLDSKTAQITNPPVIDMNSDAFKALDKNVQDILKAEVERQAEAAKVHETTPVSEIPDETSVKTDLSKDIEDHLKELQAKIDARKASMTPEEKASREAKEAELNAIRDARLGKTGDYTIKYNEDVTDKDGNVIHKKGDTKRVVHKDEKFIQAYNERQAIIAKNLGKARGK